MNFEPASEFNPLTSIEDSLDILGTDSSSNGSSGWESDVSSEPSFAEQELPLVDDLLRITRNLKTVESLSCSESDDDIFIPEQVLSLHEDLLRMRREQNLETIDIDDTPENAICFESEGNSDILVSEQVPSLNEDLFRMRREQDSEITEMDNTSENSLSFESEENSGILVPEQESSLLDEDLLRILGRKRFVFPADLFNVERWRRQEPEQPILTTETKVLLGVGIVGIGAYVCWKYFNN